MPNRTTSQTSRVPAKKASNQLTKVTISSGRSKLCRFPVTLDEWLRFPAARLFARDWMRWRRRVSLGFVWVSFQAAGQSRTARFQGRALGHVAAGELHLGRALGRGYRRHVHGLSGLEQGQAVDAHGFDDAEAA